MAVLSPFSWALHIEQMSVSDGQNFVKGMEAIFKNNRSRLKN
jgi:hypothetical protein